MDSPEKEEDLEPGKHMMGRVVVMSSNVSGSTQLLDIIAMTICAIGGAQGWSDVELFVQCKYEWFQRFLTGSPVPPLGGYSPALVPMDWVSSVNRL